MAFKKKELPKAQVPDLSGIPPAFEPQVFELLNLAKEKGATSEQLYKIATSAKLLVNECEKFPPAASYLLSQVYFTINKKGPAEAMNQFSEVLLPNSKHYVGAVSCLAEDIFHRGHRLFNPKSLESPEFRYDLFTTVSMVLEMDQNPSKPSIPILNGILSNPSFEPPMLKTIQIALEKSGNPEIALRAVSIVLGSIFETNPDHELISENLRMISMICKNCGPPESVAKALHEFSQILPDDLMQADALRQIARVAKDGAGNAFMALRQNGGASRSFYDGSFRESTPLSFIERRSDFMLQIAVLYQGGKNLARSLGARHEDAEVCLNFAYALMSLGREKTAKLYKEAGIEYFMRYKVDTLNGVYSNMAGKNKNKPVLLAVMNKNDPNGAFYQEGNSLGDLTKHYRVLIREVGSEDAFNDAVEQTHSRYGKIGALLIGGHGTPGDILLGAGDEEGKLDLTDREELVHLKGSLAKNPLVVLLSCSTGQDDKSIGAMLSKVWGATLFAPKEPSSTTRYILSDEGKISSVMYNVDTSHFSLGVLSNVYSKETR